MVIKEINEEAKEIAVELKIADRVHITSKKEAFISIKDHKKNFKNDPRCPLLNPTKSELGQICKQNNFHNRQQA